MKFKILKELEKGENYEIICSLPISFLDWIELTKDVEKLKRKVLKRDNDVLLITIGTEKVIFWERKIWDGFNERRQDFLTLDLMSLVGEIITERLKAGNPSRIYITAVSCKRGKDFDEHLHFS